MYGMLGVDNLSWNHGRRQRGGQWCLASPFEIGAPHFTFGPPVATYIQHCILKIWPSLLLNPGDGPAWNIATI